MASQMHIKIGIIGGSGLDDPDILEGRTERYVNTPYGNPSDALIVGKIKNGCTHLLVTTACGSLREEIQPGDIVIIDQFIDRVTQIHRIHYPV
ncbi:hypothetical protein CRUP_027906 [Coryphaenoides rupestris]|nr:hypothetical protein CRUP_027906 [Coryphaenoides rupestris]